MKRIGFCYEKLCNEELIKLAIKNAARNKRRRHFVKVVADNPDHYAKEVSRMLKDKAFTPHEYERVKIYDGIRKKERIISKPIFYPDQVVHWAIYLVIRDWLYKSFYTFTCGSVPGKGVHFGKKYIERWLVKDRKNTKYYLKLDIYHFYPSINPHLLIDKLKTKFKDDELIELLEKILYEDDGLPIGMLLSQVFANFYLTDFDYWVKQELGAKYYIRYMDDIVIFSGNKKELHQMRVAISDRLQAVEKLRLKGNWQVCKLEAEPLDFMGFRFLRGRTIIRKSIMLRISRRARKVGAKKKITHKDACAVISYLGWVKASDSHHFYVHRLKPYLNMQKLKAAVRKGTP